MNRPPRTARIMAEAPIAGDAVAGSRNIHMPYTPDAVINYSGTKAFVLTTTDGDELLRIDLQTGEVSGPIEQTGRAAEVFVAALRMIAGLGSNFRQDLEAVDALKALIAVRPENWDDEVDDPEAYRAWRDAEDLLRRLGELS